VRNLHEDFLPEHLAYLRHFFSRRPMNDLFPVSITLSTAAAALLVHVALAAPAGSFEAASLALASALLLLAILEHWLMVLPVEDTPLWKWAMASRAVKAQASMRVRGKSAT